MLALSGTRINLKALSVSARQELSGKDMSGATSATMQADIGDKAKVLAVTGTIPFSAPEELRKIYAIAGSRKEGERTVYRIANKTADALKIMEVVFQGNVTAQESPTTREWQVSFEMIEKESTAEREEQRQPATKATQQQAIGTETVPPTAQAADVPPDTTAQLGTIESFFKRLDDALA